MHLVPGGVHQAEDAAAPPILVVLFHGQQLRQHFFARQTVAGNRGVGELVHCGTSWCPGPDAASSAVSTYPDAAHQTGGMATERGTDRCSGVPHAARRRGVGGILGGHRPRGTAPPGVRLVRDPAVPSAGHVPTLPIDRRATGKRVSGTGTIWSFVVCHPPLLPAYAPFAPYPVITVTLDEGPALRMVGNLVTGPDGAINGIDPATIVIGEPVRAVFSRRRGPRRHGDIPSRVGTVGR